MMVLCLMNVFFRNVKSLKEGHGRMCLAWPSSASNNEAPNKPEVDAKKLFFCNAHARSCYVVLLMRFYCL